MSKAEWRDRDFVKYEYPPQHDYVMFKELALSSGDVIARIEQFVYPNHIGPFYATTSNERSGPLNSYEAARQWCEARSGNKPN